MTAPTPEAADGIREELSFEQAENRKLRDVLRQVFAAFTYDAYTGYSATIRDNQFSRWRHRANVGTKGTHTELAGLAAELEKLALSIEADPFPGIQMGAADIGRALAYRDSAKRIRKALEDS